MDEAFMKKVHESVRDTEIRKKLGELGVTIVWGRFARTYFEKSASWFYNKLNGIDGNGGPGGFSPEELEQFRAGLHDLAERIHHTAESL